MQLLTAGMRRSPLIGISGLLAGLFASCTFMAFVYAPTEATMGPIQRILYIHVSLAWCALGACVAMGFCAGMSLWQRRLLWDYWTTSAGEVSWLCLTLTLITGSLWARQAWGVWWTWEPRLTTSLVLWFMFGGIFLVRSAIDEVHKRARIGAVMALLAVMDVPMILVATRWFRGVHPIAPEMDPRMRLTLLVTASTMAAVFFVLVLWRRLLLELAHRAALLENQSHPLT